MGTVMQTRSFWLLAVSFLVNACGGSGSGGGNFVSPPPPSPPPPAPTVAVERAFPQLGFASPVLMLQAPADATRWFVVEQAGAVRVFDNDPNAAATSEFMNISGRVQSGGEGGLLGFAFHPDFPANSTVFASYTAAGPFRSVLSRFTVVGGSVDPNSEAIIYEVPQPEGNHNGGHIEFGPDRLLYFGLGDGGGSGDPGENGQDPTNVLGTIVRIDVNGAAPYEIPNDNPFGNNTNCVDGSGQMECPEIYAWGLRNPWRFSFDQQSGELWAGDVGQASWEEVNRIELGMNYGWDEREGANCFEPATGCSLMNVDPVAEYSHSVGSSVTGGYVYRGATLPALQGQYLFGDFISGRIWSVPADATLGTQPVERLDTSLSISSFGQAVDGEVFVVDYGGELYRLVPP